MRRTLSPAHVEAAPAGISACGGAAPAGVTIRLPWSRRFRFIAGGEFVHRYCGDSSVVPTPIAVASAITDAALFELSNVSSGAALNLNALDCGGSAANCASIAG